MLSVVVPIHNGASWLAETLKSIYAQSCADFELILVDDASTDKLREVLAMHPDHRLQVLHLEKNVGVAEARNAGIAKARGQYIAFCDADDLCDPRRFEAQLAYLQVHPAIGACGTAFTCFDSEDRETVTNPTTNAEIKRTLLRGNCFGMSTMMGRAELFRRHPFDQSFAPSEDYDMWARLSSAGVGLANLPDSLIRYRWHAQQASRTKSAKLDQATRRIRGRYCASMLGDAEFMKRLLGESLTLDDLRRVADLISRQTQYPTQDFRFLLAWVYQLLPHHGMREWRCWKRIQRQLGLTLDRTYRINTAALAWLPRWLTAPHFDTLIKLKR